MPRTGQYSGDSGKLTGISSGGSTGVPEHDGGLDTNASVVFDVPTTTYYTRAIQEQNLTVWERENMGKERPIDDVTGATGTTDNLFLAWTYDKSLTNESREAAAGPNETYADNTQSSDTRRDFSKGHGAAPPTQLAPECRQVGSADQTANPPKNPDQGASNARVSQVK